MRNNKKILIVGLITLLVMVGVIGGAFAYFIFANTGENQVLITGDVFMKYTESNTVIDAELMMPRSEYDPETYFEFTIEGKNTHSQDLYYEILINHGEEHETRKTRLDDKFLRFRLEEIVGEEVTPVIEEGTYEEIDNTKIWVNTIASNTKTKTSIKYRLYMWITNEVNISASGDYTNEVWNNDVFASIKVNVNGDFEEKKLTNEGPAIDIVKAKVVAYANASKSDFGGGLVAVNTNGTLYNETAGNETIREYRYTGLNVNNYIYYNCKDKDEEGNDVEQNADNCEKWRIVGVFKDENGAEHLKIVKNEVLTRDMFPATFEANNTTYNIQQSSSRNYAYWNKKTSGTENNDWATAGLQYWLNGGEKVESKSPSAGYMSYLSKNAKDMIEKTKYYLGTVTYYDDPVDDDEDGNVYGIWDTPIEAYANERAVSGCTTEGKGPSTNSSTSVVEENSSCRVWANNSATWEGLVALLYPSDYGYSANSSYWSTTKLAYNSFNKEAQNTAWLQKGVKRSDFEWSLSPSSKYSYGVADLDSSGYVNTNYVGSNRSVRPTLYLKFQTKIVDGDGSSLTPYELEPGELNNN